MLYLGPSPISTTSQPFFLPAKGSMSSSQHLSPRHQAEEQMPFCHDPWDKDPPIALASCPYYRRRWPPAPVHRWGAPTEREGCKTWSISFGSFILRLCDDFFIMFVYERVESFRVQFLHECPWIATGVSNKTENIRKQSQWFGPLTWVVALPVS